MRESFKYDPPQQVIHSLYMDDDIVVFNKPSGLLSVPGRDPAHVDSLQTRAQRDFPSATIVHRLDMDTSGVMIMALHKNAHRNLSSQFEFKRCKKRYIALVDGVVTEDSGSVDLPLRCDWPNRPLQIVDFELGKKALTHWQVLDRLDDRTRIELLPVTGRSHQLRVHCLSMGHPILGDRFYGSAEIIAKEKRLCLHAQALEIFHPSHNGVVKFECEPDF